jgi:hypothetical protein
MSKIENGAFILKAVLIGEAALASAVVPATLGMAFYEGMESRAAYEQGNIERGDELASQANGLYDLATDEAPLVLGAAAGIGLAAAAVVYSSKKKETQSSSF